MKVLNRKELRLFACTLPFVTLPLGVALWKTHYPSEITVSIESVPIGLPEQRASIKRLDELIKRYPSVTTFLIDRKNPGRGSLVYRRYPYNSTSGVVSWSEFCPPGAQHCSDLNSTLEYLNDENIHSVAGSGGVISDLIKISSINAETFREERSFESTIG